MVLESGNSLRWDSIVPVRGGSDNQLVGRRQVLSISKWASAADSSGQATPSKGSRREPFGERLSARTGVFSGVVNESQESLDGETQDS